VSDRRACLQIFENVEPFTVNLGVYVEIFDQSLTKFHRRRGGAVGARLAKMPKFDRQNYVSLALRHSYAMFLRKNK